MTVPCRLFVILARRADKAVLIRRGPTRWVHLSLWHTDTDTIEHGQWFHGRIYERRCDLSPDGSLFIYFAQKINGRIDPAYTYAWTAVSKPPYFTALALWPKGDCWNGGGLFEKQKKVWLNHAEYQAAPHPRHKPKGLQIVLNKFAGGEDSPIYWLRLKRDGWINQQLHKKHDYWYGHFEFDQPDMWQKFNAKRSASLLMRTSGVNFRRPGGNPYLDEFSLMFSGGKAAIPIEGANWADWDQRGRLVYTSAGQLYAATIEPVEGTYHPVLLHDFNTQQPELIESPGWAQRW
jgi:hypothetical protein